MDSPVAEATCRIARITTLLAAIGLLLNAVFWKTVMGRMFWGAVASVAVSSVLFAVLFVLRSRPREWIGTSALLLNNTVAVAALWVSDDLLWQTSASWTPFDVQRLAALTMALLAPPRIWLGVFTIAQPTAASLAEYWLLNPNARARLPINALWIAAVYGVFAFALYAHLLRAREMERRAARAQADRLAMERFTQMLLALRDLANTPLQTMELTMGMLRAKGAGDPRLLELVGRLDRACKRLVRMGHSIQENTVTYPDTGQGGVAEGL
jgi:hypothetical protein